MTLQRATLFAAVAAALQALVFVFSTVIPALTLNVSLDLRFHLLMPAAGLLLTLWAAFFWCLYREYSGIPSQMPSRRISILLALILTATYFAEQIASNVVYRPWLADLRSWGMLFAWLAFLVAYWAGPEQPRTRKIAKVLAVLVALNGLYESRFFSVWLAAITGSYRLQWLYHPVDAAWQTAIRPGVPILVWVSEAVFLWLFWKTPPPTERTPLS